jgi:hypothetical protein
MFAIPPSWGQQIKRCPECRHLPHQQPCTVCGVPFHVSPSRAAKVKRCSECVATGRARCFGCGQELRVAAGQRHPALCETCRADGAVHFPMVERITVQCRGYAPFGGVPRHAKGCKRTYSDRPAYLAQHGDYDATGQTFRSGPCAAALRRVEVQLERFKDAGKAFRGPVRSWTQYAEYRRLLSDDWPALRAGREDPDVRRTARERLSVARKAGRGGSRGPVLRDAIMVASWKRGVAWRVYRCSWPACGRLMLYWRASGTPAPRFHSACYHAARRSPDGKEWRRRRLQGRRDGLTPAELDAAFGAHMPAAARPGPEPEEAKLTRDFGWAVRNRLGKASQAALGNEVYPRVSQQGVERRIRQVLARLPDPQLADHRLRRYIEAFRSAPDGT